MPTSRHRGGRLQRRGPRVEPNARILIISEGSVSEPEYFHGLRRLAETSLVDIEIQGNGETPKTIVERAVLVKRQNARDARRAGDTSILYDEIWCVFDIDGHPLVPDALQQARANGLKVAVSNPCFELWLVLHFQDQRAFIDRHAIQRVYARIMSERTKHVDFPTLHSNYPIARDRANWLARYHIELEQAGENPSTGVVALTERILELGRERRLNS